MDMESLRILRCFQLIFAEMVASLQRSGQTVRGFLDELYQKYGYFQVKDIFATFTLDPEHLQDEQWLSRLL